VKDIEFFDTLKGALEDGIAHNKGEIELKTTEVKGETNEESLHLVCKHCKNMISIFEHKQHQKICEKNYVNRELGVPGGIDPEKVPPGTGIVSNEYGLCMYSGWDNCGETRSVYIWDTDSKQYEEVHMDSCRLADDVAIPKDWIME